ncbi:heat shock protein Hsp18 [Clostridium kluyveri]|uniref:heat shock protein Hsp18 n=1 Tax=Clostridium kluyveri TaxID=1534 RepID=UPI0022458AC8|nr:heat shock protein Hsp18 [Clostridium kluyveri]UZQ48599.1 Hsp20/alpha crystallin family protein [Clostridium kluyveri]
MFDMVPFRKNNSIRRGDDAENFFNSFFNNDFLTPFNMNLFNNGLKVDLKETDTSYLIEADLPGIKKDAIDLNFDNNYLTISAKRDDTIEDNKENFIRRERRYGEFKRSFYIDNVDEKNITASFEEGVLKIELPKLEKGKGTNNKIEIH